MIKVEQAITDGQESTGIASLDVDNDKKRVRINFHTKLGDKTCYLKLTFDKEGLEYMSKILELILAEENENE
uniref:Uncharacterized protein n=1 Tax=viral metagenome TaxID=1070528 RepID=A0A6M3L673_9ZZZZ